MLNMYVCLAENRAQVIKSLYSVHIAAPLSNVFPKQLRGVFSELFGHKMPVYIAPKVKYSPLLTSEID